MYYNRQTKRIEEDIEYQQSTLNFLYNSIPGRIILKLFVARPWFSKIKSKYQKSSKSKKDIAPFVKKYKIDIDNIDFFNSFNDFFIRKKEIIIPENKNDFISIADSKLSVYKISEDLKLNIKNTVYTIEDILENKELAKRFNNGLCLVFRLSVDDYHRYLYPDSGSLLFNKKIKGLLHTVRPISSKYKIYSRNSREVSLLNTESLGDVIQIEVGALLIGKINNHQHKNFKKGQEKGYFEFGGSTIVLLIKENKVVIDDDIIKYSQQDIETKVYSGEKIGTIKENNKNV